MALSEKLGLGGRAYVLHAPTEYAGLLSGPVAIPKLEGLPEELDWLHAFYTDQATLAREFSDLKRSLAKTGQLWISWPKRSSGVVSDLSDQAVRSIGLADGLVDTKVAAINETWSGLKFVYRLADR